MFAALASAAAQAQAPVEFALEDPTKIATAEACGECHVSEYEVWKRTPHAVGFKSLHRGEVAEAITQRMGFRLMKRDSPCLTCHYTPTVQGEQLRAVSGVSCENCHGAGQDWIDLHNDYGGKGIDHTTETPEHREQRIAASLAAGMRRPTDLYDVATSCYGCHTVPDERLVNVGKHSIGSPSFELVAWSEKIRHNFLDSFRDGDGTANAERSPERKRMMYLAGRALELEHALRGVAAATERGVYLKAMQRRVRDALTEVRGIAAAGALTEMDEAVAIIRSVDLKLGNREALLQAADRLGQATKQMLAGRDGTQLASLDPLVEGTAEAADFIEDEFDDLELAEPEVAVAASGDPAAGSETSSDPAAGGSPAAGSGSQATTTTVVTTEAIPAVGEAKPRIRPRSRFATLSGDTCQKCHGEQNAWWFDDPHYAAIEPFLARDRKNVQIARLYGISPSRMARGDSLCMDCHGTIVTGREKREVQDGVSCQGCHGPAAEFLEPHQEGDKSLGTERPGYINALQLGMVELQNLKTRAETCTGCHYITDRRLISSGHPSGVDFDYVDGMAEIRHWQSPPIGAPALNAVFSSELESRGAVPKVQLARLATTTRVAAAGGSGSTASEGQGTATDTTATGDESYVYRPQAAPRARPHDRRAASSGNGASGLGTELPPFPEVEEGTAIEDILRLLKDRLELLYRAVRPETTPGGQR
ncbi:MAG: multiheme c-type cytochrome [Acidobacteriota bacterium]